MQPIADPEISALVDHAERTFGDPAKARRWLERRTTALEGRSPRSLLDTHTGRVAVERLLSCIDHGLAV